MSLQAVYAAVKQPATRSLPLVLARAFHVTSPSQMMKKGKKGEASGPEDLGPGCDLHTATGINLLKSGSDPPLAATEEYPDWLWRLLDPTQTLTELERAYKAELEGTGPHLNLEQLKRLRKLRNRRAIKLKNELKAKN